ncbi:hypothetical protein KP509_1Z240500 [Ceratopteris richardii]|nr:hypothetical protein KP509_1Z240500 [Ceratopteris richardii]
MQIDLAAAVPRSSSAIGALRACTSLNRSPRSSRATPSHTAHLRYDRNFSLRATGNLVTENITDSTQRIDLSQRTYRLGSTLFADTDGESLCSAKTQGKRYLDDFQYAQLRLLANATLDRCNMHEMLATQRDNWNKLFQSTVTLATLSACLLSALSAAQIFGSFSPSLSVPASLLNGRCFFIMSVVNRLQPSQLAEEQRSAVRQLRRLHDDIQYTITAPSDIQRNIPDLLYSLQQRLRALDKAFPIPLPLSSGLERFPRTVTPPALLTVEASASDSDIVTPQLNREHLTFTRVLGTSKILDKSRLHNLQRLASQIRSSETNMYLEWATNVIKVNKIFAILAPSLAALACLLNTASVLQGGVHSYWTGTLAAICSIFCVFIGSISNDLQLGAVYEMYRNAAGHYAEAEESIDNMLREQPANREDGLLFMERLAYKLGRWDDIFNDNCQQ